MPLPARWLLFCVLQHSVFSAVSQCVNVCGAANTKQLWQKTIVSAGPLMWNSILVQLHNPNITKVMFKWQSKGHLFWCCINTALWHLICSASEKQFTEQYALRVYYYLAIRLGYHLPGCHLAHSLPTWCHVAHHHEWVDCLLSDRLNAAQQLLPKTNIGCSRTCSIMVMHRKHTADISSMKWFKKIKHLVHRNATSKEQIQKHYGLQWCPQRRSLGLKASQKQLEKCMAKPSI